jgi:hypothetical protein
MTDFGVNLTFEAKKTNVVGLFCVCIRLPVAIDSVCSRDAIEPKLCGGVLRGG